MARKKTDHIKFRGYLEFVLKDARTGKVVKRGKTHNTVTAGGRGWAMAKLTPASDAQVLSAIAIGSISSTAPSSNQTALGGYMTIRNFGTTGLTSATNSACTFYGAVSFNTNETFSGSSQIGEFAIYNSASTGSGVMFNRVVTASYINFATSNTLAVSISITN
ncbi:MAG: hypothetical protein QUS09_02775 [Methanotrichaceae archaeon]|nr:hypothetical protein [Methanotrichaceae archaeon]